MKPLDGVRLFNCSRWPQLNDAVEARLRAALYLRDWCTGELQGQIVDELLNPLWAQFAVLGGGARRGFIEREIAGIFQRRAG